MTVAIEPPTEVSLDGLTHGQRLRLLDTWPAILARHPDDPATCLAVYRGVREYIDGTLTEVIAGNRLTKARRNEAIARAVARQVAIMAMDGAGTSQEKYVANNLGVDRMTVRNWIGK